MRSRLDSDPLAAFRIPAFRAYLVSRAAGGAAMTLLQATISWQVYQITGSALQLGLIGLIRFLPALLASLVGGAVADAYNRRTIILIAQFVPFLTTAAVLASIATGEVSMALLYAVVFVAGLASSFENPARQSWLPHIVPRDLFAKAITLNATVWSLAFITGPTLGGVLIGVGGVGAAYVAHAMLVLTSMLAVTMVRVHHDPSTRGSVSVGAIREGVTFVWRRPVLLSAMLLDMFAVIFGGAKALLPIYAKDILEVGPAGYGVLSASMEAGALLMSLALVVLPPVRRSGRALLLSVAAFGLATVVFGLSRSYMLSIVAYMAVGAADQISVVMRQTTIQLATPDILRGRVTAVNQVFISASNQLSAAAFIAAFTSATVAVASGGLGCLAVVAFAAWRVPALRRYRTDTPAADEPSAAAG